MNINELSNEEQLLSPDKLELQDYVTPAIVIILWFISFLIGTLIFPLFLSGTNLQNIFYQVVYILPAVLAIALTSNKRIPDLSFFSMFILSQSIIQSFASPAIGVIVALLLCTILGGVSGLLIAKTKIRPVFLMLGVAVILLVVGLYLLQNFNKSALTDYDLNSKLYRSFRYIVGFGALLLSIGLALSKRLWSLSQPEKRGGYILIYALSSLFATLMGIVYLALMRSTHIYLSTIFTNSILLIMVFTIAVMMSSALFKRVLPSVLFAVIIALLYQSTSNIFSILAVNYHVFPITVAILSAVFFIISPITNRSNRNHISKNG